MASAIKLSDEVYAQRWEGANIPIRFRGVRLNDYEPSHYTGAEAKKHAEAFVDAFEDHHVSAKRAAAGIFPSNRDNIGRGLLFFGRNGTRKSSLANAILTEIQYRSPSYGVFYVRFSDWKKALTDTFEKEDSENKVRAKKILQATTARSIVVLDDIGQEHRTQSGFTESSLHELLRVRYEAARPTIITTNVSMSKIAEIYGDSFDSFRHDAFDAYPMLGIDTRKTED